MKLRERVGRLLARFAEKVQGRSGEVPYKSPQEMALQNAADSLGVTLGEYYPDDVDTPTAGPMPLEPGDDPHADAVREELLAYAATFGANKARQRRVRRIAIAGALGIGIMIAAGLVAIDGTSDSDEDSRNARSSKRPIGGPAMTFASAPAPLGTSVSSELRFSGWKLVNSTYLNRYGEICSALIEVRNGISEKNTAHGCRPPAEISAEVGLEPAVTASMVRLTRWTIIQGYARPDVERIAGRSPWGAIRVSMTRAWLPDGSERVRPLPIKAFVVAARHPGTGSRLLPADVAARALDDRTYNLVAGLSNGRVVPVGSPMTPGVDARDRLIDPIATAFED